MLTHELRYHRVNGSLALLDVLRQQEKIHFRDIITGNESWIFIDTEPSSIWLSLDEELPARPRPTIGTDKQMLVVFWGIKGIMHVNWLPRNARINAPDLRDELLTQISQKLQEHASGGRKLWTLVHMDSTKVHTAAAILTVVPDFRLKRIPHRPYSPDICPSDFFLFGWFKGKLQQRQLTDADQLFIALDEILSSISVDPIEDVFRNWIHWLERVIELNGRYVE
jgi:histone-lysine N-methyltransferase SETMAR